MKKILILGLILLAGCGQSQTGQKTETNKTAVKPDRTFRLDFAGDVMFTRGFNRYIDQGIDPLREVAPILRQATIAYVNLETTVSTRGEKVVKEVNLRSDPSTMKFLTNAGIDAVSLGNNHVMDYGEVAFKDTLKSIDAVGVLRTGAGTNLTHARTPIIIESNGFKIGLLSYGDVYPTSLYANANRPGNAGVDSTIIVADIVRYKPKVDFLAVSVHWGDEYIDDAGSRQITLAHLFIDKGADLVIGHHPHVLQAFEMYKGKMIFYSMGNFVFDQVRYKTRFSMIVSATLEKVVGTNGITNLTAVYRITPLFKNETNYMPEIPTPKMTAEIVAHLLKLSSVRNRGIVKLIPDHTAGYTNYIIAIKESAGINKLPNTQIKPKTEKPVKASPKTEKPTIKKQPKTEPVKSVVTNPAKLPAVSSNTNRLFNKDELKTQSSN